MRIVKLLVWIIIIGLFGLITYQNWEFFRDKQSLSVNLFFTEYKTPALPIAFLMAFMFLFGWLLAYLAGLADRFGVGQHNKRLRQTINQQQSAIDAMKKDVAALKPRTEPVTAPLPSEEEAAAPSATDETDAESPKPAPPDIV